ncbi:MAG: hypothetical protein AMXMBFR84_13750 [Candidatus Hydrogenedentota bacterium]
MPRRRLIWQLFPWFLVIILGTTMALSIYASTALRGFHLNETRQDLEARASLAIPHLLVPLREGDFKTLQSLCRQLASESGTQITVVLPDGKVVADSLADPNTIENLSGRPEIRGALSGLPTQSDRFSDSLNTHMVYAAKPAVVDGKVIAAVRAAVPFGTAVSALSRIYREIAFGCGVIVIIAIPLSLIVSRRITRPLEEMTRGAHRFAQGDLRSRLNVPDSEEMGGLADAMNRMALQLEDRMGAVTRQKNELEAVLSSMIEGVLAIDSDERILSMNSAAARMIEIEPERVLGRTIHEAIRNAELLRLITRALEKMEPVEGEIVLRRRQERVLSVQGTPLTDSKRRTFGVLIVLYDITRLRRLEQARKDFVANVSHELKTPITSIKGYVETLLEGAMSDPDDARRFLTIIGKQAERLNLLIEDLLTLSRLERDDHSDEIVIQRAPLAPVVEAAVQQYLQMAAGKNIHLRVDTDPELQIRMNPSLLQLAVGNLLENAIKYSENGTEVFVEAHKNGAGVYIKVRDQGCGIEQEHIPRIFERFYRVDRARSRKLGGTGLGLAIVKHIVRLHGGEISVESNLNKGSEFSIRMAESLAPIEGSSE